MDVVLESVPQVAPQTIAVLVVFFTVAEKDWVPLVCRLAVVGATAIVTGGDVTVTVA